LNKISTNIEARTFWNSFYLGMPPGFSNLFLFCFASMWWRNIWIEL